MTIEVLNEPHDDVGYVSALRRKGNVVWAVGGHWGKPLVMTSAGGAIFRRRKPPPTSGLPRRAFLLTEDHAIAVGGARRSVRDERRRDVAHPRDRHEGVPVRARARARIDVARRRRGVRAHVRRRRRVAQAGARSRAHLRASVASSASSPHKARALDHGLPGQARRRPQRPSRARSRRVHDAAHRRRLLGAGGRRARWRPRHGLSHDDEGTRVDARSPGDQRGPRGRRRGTTGDSSSPARNGTLLGLGGRRVVRRAIDTQREDHLWSAVAAPDGGFIIGGAEGLLLHVGKDDLERAQPGKKKAAVAVALVGADTSLTDEEIERASKRWTEEGTRFYEALNAFVAQFYDPALPKIEIEPDETRKDMAPLVLRAAVALNAQKRFDDLRRMFPPSFEAFDYEALGQSIRAGALRRRRLRSSRASRTSSTASAATSSSRRRSRPSGDHAAASTTPSWWTDGSRCDRASTAPRTRPSTFRSRSARSRRSKSSPGAIAASSPRTSKCAS